MNLRIRLADAVRCVRGSSCASSADLSSAHCETVGAGAKVPVRPRMQDWPGQAPIGHGPLLHAAYTGHDARVASALLGDR